MSHPDWMLQFDLYGDYMGDITARCLKCFRGEWAWVNTGSPTLVEVIDWAFDHFEEGCTAYVEANTHGTSYQ